MASQILAVAGFQMSSAVAEGRELWMVQFYNHNGRGVRRLSLPAQRRGASRALYTPRDACTSWVHAIEKDDRDGQSPSGQRRRGRRKYWDHSIVFCPHKHPPCPHGLQ